MLFSRSGVYLPFAEIATFLLEIKNSKRRLDRRAEKMNLSNGLYDTVGNGNSKIHWPHSI